MSSRRFNDTHAAGSPTRISQSRQRRGSDPESPEPPQAPPVIILSHNTQSYNQSRRPDPAFSRQPHTSSAFSASSDFKDNVDNNTDDNDDDDDNNDNNSTAAPRYYLRHPHKNTAHRSIPDSEFHPEPVPDPEPPEPEPDPAQPIIILPGSTSSTVTTKKRVASASPAPSSISDIHSTSSLTALPTDTDNNDSTAAAPHKRRMGSKASKISEAATGKLKPAQSKQDKEEMKEPSNYYSHRSKSMRRKAGRGGATAAGGQGSGAGI